MIPVARGADRFVTVTISVAFGCPFEGEVDPATVIRIAERAVAAGAQEVALGDTIGVAVPSDVSRIVPRLQDAIGDSGVRVHLHATRPTGPGMGAEKREALDLLHELGFELGLTHRFQPGDIQYLNNHILYHGRTAYEDGPENGTGGKRLLYRIWISMANSRPLPAGHAVLFGEVAAGVVRGGIRQPDGSNVPVGVVGV